jgi:hypothetical protein
VALARTTLAAFAGLAILGGCASSTPSPSRSVAVDDFAAVAQSALGDAQASGASTAQLALIERALAHGEVTFSDVQEAVDATIECFEAAGIRYKEFAPVDDHGILYPSYAFEGEQETAVADECIHTNSDYIEMLYMRQPAAMEARDAAFLVAMPLLIDCLEGLGHDIDDDITPDELKEWFRLAAVEMASSDTNDRQADTFRCVGKAGIDGW